MDLVDADGRGKSLMLGPMVRPDLVLPLVAFEVPHHRGGAWPKLGGKAEGIGFVDAILRKARFDAVLVLRTLACARHEALPDAGRSPRLQGCFVGIPLVELTDHADRVGMGRPYGERHARLTVDRRDMRAQ